jgi:hypothetical protein
MGTLAKYGLLLAAGVIVWMFVMGFTGWYRNPVLVNLFFLVIPYQVLVIVWALRETARQGANYGAQVLAGLTISSIAGILVFGASILFTTIAFPNYFTEIREMQEHALREAGIGEARIAEMMAGAEQAYTPIRQAIQGFIGTVITGLVTAGIAGRWIRHRPEQVGPGLPG